MMLENRGLTRQNRASEIQELRGGKEKKRFMCFQDWEGRFMSGIQMEDRRKQTEKEAPAFEATNPYGDIVLIKIIRTKKLKKKRTKSYQVSWNDS